MCVGVEEWEKAPGQKRRRKCRHSSCQGAHVGAREDVRRVGGVGKSHKAATGASEGARQGVTGWEGVEKGT